MPPLRSPLASLVLGSGPSRGGEGGGMRGAGGRSSVLLIGVE
jgi:hypothetical protein